MGNALRWSWELITGSNSNHNNQAKNFRERLTGKAQQQTRQLQLRHPAIVKIKHPCRILVSGRSQSGKTTLASDILMWLHPQVDIIILCSPTQAYQKTWIKVEDYINYRVEKPQEAFDIVDGITEKEGNSKRVLLVMDDISYEQVMNTGNKGTISKLSYNAIWLNITLLVVCHKTHNISNSVRENLEHYIQFRTTSPTELDEVADNFNIFKSPVIFKQVYHKLITDEIESGKNLHPFMYICYKEGDKLFYCFKEQIKIS